MTEPTKLETLPWFAFNIAAYQTGTGRLTTEAHGAYLLLMCDYYGKGIPCPDDDFILAAVTRLPIESWKRHRKVLEPLFDVREGYWFHTRIQEEMLGAAAKHAASIEKARNAANAKHEKRREERGIPEKTPAKRTRSAPSTAPSMPQAVLEASPEQCLEHTHIHIHNTTPSSRSISDDATTEVPSRVLEEDQVGTPVSPQFQPSEAVLARCDADGASADEIANEIRLFIAYNDDRNSFSTDWDKTWALWWARYVARRPKPVPPRVEVNSRPEPTEAELSRALVNFAKGIPWAYRSLGPEPGQLGCRVAPALIEKHGIDPKTGFKRRTEPVT
jgi:uncharacterized protein YdaU (DUF1376 family)